MADDKETIQHAERERRHRKEVHRRDGLAAGIGPLVHGSRCNRLDHGQEFRFNPLCIRNRVSKLPSQVFQLLSPAYWEIGTGRKSMSVPLTKIRPPPKRLPRLVT